MWTSKNFLWPSLIAITAALFLAATHVAQRRHAAHSAQLEISIASPAPFEEEIPRTGELTFVHQEGSTVKLASRRYASAFLDARSAFRFEIPVRGIRQVHFSPLGGREPVAVLGASVTAPGSNIPEPIGLEKVVPNPAARILEQNASRIVARPGSENTPLVFTIDLPARDSVKLDAARLTAETTLLFVLGLVGTFFLARSIRNHLLTTSVAQMFPLWNLLPFALPALLIVAMALLTKFNAHPDEYLHFETARYFVNHWWPAPLNDPTIAPTFSHYGFSYMSDLDVAYFLMGKFIALLQGWLTTPEIAARLFNVLLFVILAAWLARRLEASLAPFILLISPQVWYVFSYVNGDAWALFVAMLIVVQLADQKSGLQRYFEGKTWSDSLRGAVSFALLLALMIMAKRNYYLFLLFVGFVAGWATLSEHGLALKIQRARKWIVVLLLAAAFYSPVRIAHEALNGFDIPRRQQEQAEKYAAPHFKPSEIAAGTGAGRLVMRNKGVPFAELFTERGWLGESFQSFCGVYRWMRLKDNDYYYVLMGLLYAALVASLLVRVVRLSWRDALFAAGVLTTAGLVVLISAYHSWTADYQPQGRYLFPILPMFAFLFYRYREALRSRAFYLLFGCLFACSIYSFIFTGLRNIPK